MSHQKKFGPLYGKWQQRLNKLAKFIPQVMDFGETVEQVISSNVCGYNFTYFVLQTRGFHKVTYHLEQQGETEWRSSYQGKILMKCNLYINVISPIDLRKCSDKD